VPLVVFMPLGVMTGQGLVPPVRGLGARHSSLWVASPKVDLLRLFRPLFHLLILELNVVNDDDDVLCC
jgi:hypothetical protein